MLIKIIVVLLFIIVLVSLSSGLIFMVKDKSQTHRNVKALTMRVGLSILVFALLMGAYYAGLIQPHGLAP